MIFHWHVSCSFLELLELMQNVKCGVFEKSKALTWTQLEILKRKGVEEELKCQSTSGEVINECVTFSIF